MWKSIKLYSILALSLSFFLLSGFVFADSAQKGSLEDKKANEKYFINLDKATIAKGYTVSAFDNNLKLSLVPGILDENTGVDIIELNEYIPMPWKLDKLSKVYQFEFRNKKAYDNHKPFYIQFSYEITDNDYKQVYFYDKNYATWRPLPTRDYPEEKFVRSLIHLPYARIAVFSNPNVLGVGRASWYGYKGGNFAASPDFPKGSRLRVYNRENNKYVDVEINDYGPERNLHPERVVDLDKVAFSKIAALGEGVIDVIIEPLEVVPDSLGNIIGISNLGATLEPEISAKSGILINENSQEVLWEKNATTTLPLASLTKLVAIKVFFNTNPSLDTVITYSAKDEEYNYEYCNKWESSKINLKEGDTLTIEDLVYSALVGSANNAIETIVRVSGMSRENFIAKMNETVKDWGTENTSFFEPTGLSPENVSSAVDYAIIAKEVYKHPIIEKASSIPEYKFSTINTKTKFKLRNTNQLIRQNKYNIKGSKTGYLDEAGYCLMTRLKNNNDYLILVIFGASTRDTSFFETEELIQYGLRK